MRFKNILHIFIHRIWAKAFFRPLLISIFISISYSPSAKNLSMQTLSWLLQTVDILSLNIALERFWWEFSSSYLNFRNFTYNHYWRIPGLSLRRYQTVNWKLQLVHLERFSTGFPLKDVLYIKLIFYNGSTSSSSPSSLEIFSIFGKRASFW